MSSTPLLIREFAIVFKAIFSPPTLLAQQVYSEQVFKNKIYSIKSSQQLLETVKTLAQQYEIVLWLEKAKRIKS